MRPELRKLLPKYGTVFFLSALMLLGGNRALGARVRYHFTPIDANGTTTLKPGDVSGYEQKTPVLGIQRPMPGPPPGFTYLVTYWHPISLRRVTVPVTLPESTPTIAHGRNRITYDYGSYTVQVRFLPDGSVDVIYNSGFLRGW
jgi:hypothetical protein